MQCSIFFIGQKRQGLCLRCPNELKCVILFHTFKILLDSVRENAGAEETGGVSAATPVRKKDAAAPYVAAVFRKRSAVADDADADGAVTLKKDRRRKDSPAADTDAADYDSSEGSEVDEGSAAWGWGDVLFRYVWKITLMPSYTIFCLFVCF